MKSRAAEAMAGMEFSISSLISWMVDMMPWRMSTGFVRPALACSVRGVLRRASAVVSENEVCPNTLPNEAKGQRQKQRRRRVTERGLKAVVIEGGMSIR
jgi:hypothetical protein